MTFHVQHSLTFYLFTLAHVLLLFVRHFHIMVNYKSVFCLTSIVYPIIIGMSIENPIIIGKRRKHDKQYR